VQLCKQTIVIPIPICTAVFLSKCVRLLRFPLAILLIVNLIRNDFNESHKNKYFYHRIYGSVISKFPVFCVYFKKGGNVNKEKYLRATACKKCKSKIVTIFYWAETSFFSLYKKYKLNIFGLKNCTTHFLQSSKSAVLQFSWKCSFPCYLLK
jgi:hypothetical protein